MMKLTRLIVTGTLCALPTLALAQSTRPSTRSAELDQRRRDSVLAANAERRLAQAEAAYEAARRQDMELRAELRAKTGRVDVSRNNLELYADKLDKDLEALSLEQAGASARMAALEEAMKKQTQRVEQASKEDAVILEYQKVADARERQYSMIEKERKAGLATDASLQDATALLADARAKVAERRQAVFTANGGDTLSALNRELLNLSIADREREAKIKYLRTELDRLSAALNFSRDLQLRERMLSQAMDDFQSAQRVVSRVRAQIADQERETP